MLDSKDWKIKMKLVNGFWIERFQIKWQSKDFANKRKMLKTFNRGWK